MDEPGLVCNRLSETQEKRHAALIETRTGSKWAIVWMLARMETLIAEGVRPTCDYVNSAGTRNLLTKLKKESTKRKRAR